MKKILFTLLVLPILLTSCTNKTPKVENENIITEEERAEIRQIAGETEEEQEEYVEKMNEVSQDTSLETLEKELNETVILEEDFSDL